MPQDYVFEYFKLAALLAADKTQLIKQVAGGRLSKAKQKKTNTKAKHFKQRKVRKF